MVPAMSKLLRSASAAAVGAAVLSTALVSAPANAAAIRPADCAFRAPTSNYVQYDPATDTACRTQRNGTYLWTNGRITGVNQPTRFIASFRVVAPRGDVRPWVTFRFIRGNKVITRKVRLTAGKKATVVQRFRPAGQWAVVAILGKQRVTIGVMVQR